MELDIRTQSVGGISSIRYNNQSVLTFRNGVIYVNVDGGQTFPLVQASQVEHLINALATARKIWA